MASDAAEKQNLTTAFNRVESFGDVVWDVGLIMLLMLSATVINTSVFLTVGVSAGAYNFCIAILETLLIMMHYRKELSGTLFKLGISTLLILLLCMICKGVYDTTWDGAAYHKTAVGLLHAGWNPVYQSAQYFESLSHTLPYDVVNPIKWAEYYGKASWYFASAVYPIFHSIEAGKSYTMISMLSCGGLFYGYFHRKGRKTVQCAIIAVLAAFNPISFAQCFSYYLDGLVCSVSISALLLLICLADNGEKTREAECMAGLVASIVLLCNLKFSSLLYIAMSCFVYCLVRLIQNRKGEIKTVARQTLTLLISGVVSVLIVGATPYITNTVRWGNPLGGFWGLLETEGALGATNLEGLSNFQLLLCSAFGKMSHGQYTTVGNLLKFPFLVYSDELPYYGYVDTRFAGMGALFSGVVLLTFVLGGVLGSYIRRNHIKLSEHSVMFCALCAVTALYVVLLPQTFQMRYIGFVYFFSVFLLGSSMTEKYFGKKLFPALLAFSMLLNIAPWGVERIKDINESMDTAAVLNMLKNIDSSNYDLEVSLFHRDFTGIHYNLQNDYGLEYSYVEFERLDEEGGFIPTYSNWLYYRILTKEPREGKG